MLESKNNQGVNQSEGGTDSTSFVGATSRGNKSAINTCYIIGYCMNLAIGMFSFGVLIGQFNPVSIIFKYLQRWDDQTNTINVAVVTTTGNFGAMVGSFIAPFLMNMGKRKAMILMNLVLIVTYAL